MVDLEIKNWERGFPTALQPLEILSHALALAVAAHPRPQTKAKARAKSPPHTKNDYFTKLINYLVLDE